MVFFGGILTNGEITMIKRIINKEYRVSTSHKELNLDSRGKNWLEMAKHESPIGETHAPIINPNTGAIVTKPNMWMEHPDGHLHLPDDPHHFFSHVHAVNINGEKIIFLWRN